MFTHTPAEHGNELQTYAQFCRKQVSHVGFQAHDLTRFVAVDERHGVLEMTNTQATAVADGAEASAVLSRGMCLNGAEL